MNILLVDGNEKEASDRYTKLGMDTQFQVYEKILKKYSSSSINITTIHPAVHNNYLPLGISLDDFEAVAWTGSLLNIYNCLLYTSPSPRDLSSSRMPSSA